MLRRIFDGALIALVAWFALARLDAGGVAVGLALAAVIVFTGWRIVRLWRRYRYLLARRAEALALQASDDAAERQRGERMLRERGVAQAADMGIWTGFVMGAAAASADPAAAQGGGEAGGFYDGSADGGGFGGDMGGGM